MSQRKELQNIGVFERSLPIHVPSLHSCFCSGGPSHNPSSGQSLLLVCVPLLHVTEQSDHADHDPQSKQILILHVTEQSDHTDHGPQSKQILILHVTEQCDHADHGPQSRQMLILHVTEQCDHAEHSPQLLNSSFTKLMFQV